MYCTISLLESSKYSIRLEKCLWRAWYCGLFRSRTNCRGKTQTKTFSNLLGNQTDVMIAMQLGSSVGVSKAKQIDIVISKFIFVQIVKTIDILEKKS